MPASYPRTENDTPDDWERAEGQVGANDSQLALIEAVVSVSGFVLGPHSEVKAAIAGLPYSSHHIVQHAAVRHLDNYNIDKAPAIALTDKLGSIGTQHYYATQFQRMSGIAGTLGAELVVGAQSLDVSGVPENVIAVAMSIVNAHFSAMGHNAETPTVSPAHRKIIDDGE